MGVGVRLMLAGLGVAPPAVVAEVVVPGVEGAGAPPPATGVLRALAGKGKLTDCAGAGETRVSPAAPLEGLIGFAVLVGGEASLRAGFASAFSLPPPLSFSSGGDIS